MNQEEVEETMAQRARLHAESYRNHKYKITLLVTFEEELAIMKLFSVNKWAFIRVPAGDAPYPVHGELSNGAAEPTDLSITCTSKAPLHPIPPNKTTIQPLVHDNYVHPSIKSDVKHNTLSCTTSMNHYTIRDSSEQPSSEVKTETNCLSDSSDTISTSEEPPLELQKDIEQDVGDINNVEVNPNSSNVHSNAHECQHVNINEHGLREVKTRVGAEEKLYANQSEKSETMDVNYSEESYFQNPDHKIKGLADKKEILSRTEATLSSELKQLSSSEKQMSSKLGAGPSKLEETESAFAAKAKVKDKTLGVMHNKNRYVIRRLKEVTQKRVDKVGLGEKETVRQKEKAVLMNHTKKERKRKVMKLPEKDESTKEESPEERPTPILYEEGDSARNEIDRQIDEMSLIMKKNNQNVCCMCRKGFENEDLFKAHASQCMSALYDMRGSHTYHCTNCWAYFRQAYTLLRHRQSEVCLPGQKRKAGNFLVCEFCKKSYPSRRRSEYIHHIQAHKNERPFGCDVCGKDFVRWTTLRDHKRIHTGEKPFKCNFCPLTFISGSGQRNHELVNHTNIPKTHVCEKCGAAFKFRNRLTSHIKDVHDMPVMHTCEYCQKAFSRKGSLTHHRRVHNNQRDKICEICGKGFVSQAGLTGHMKRHRNERSFFCDDCGKGFYTKVNLKEHERTHTGDKPYACSLCNYQCAVYSNSIKHAKARHPEVQHVKDIIIKSSLPCVNLFKI